MNKTLKLIIVLVCAALAVGCISLGISSAIKSGNETVTLGNIEKTTEKKPDKPTVPKSEAESLENQLLGLWFDSALMSGYEFLSDGIVEMTYVNLTVPVVNIPINGSTKGTYTLSGNKLQMKFSIYSATIEKNFLVSVNGSTLTLTDAEDGTKSVYSKTDKSQIKKTSNENSTKPVESKPKLDDEVMGEWINGDSTKTYAFSKDGKAVLNFKNAYFPSASSSGITGTFSGTFETKGSVLTLNFKYKGKNISEKFTYAVSKNTLVLSDSSKEEEIFVRKGTSQVKDYDESDLLGTWRDSSGLSGYQFKQDNIVELTYVDIMVPVLNVPINGSFTGVYTVSGNNLTITCSIRGKAIKYEYTFALSGNTLILTDKSSSAVSTYIKK